jgi:cell fate regulator YaaT (PSP1 superfamily)
MKILDGDFSLDRKKLTFYFTAEGRVDFRSLVADMAGDYGKLFASSKLVRVRKQNLGGLGRCGQSAG